MSTYTAPYACGHGSYTEQLYGKSSARLQRLKGLEGSRLCPDCFNLKLSGDDAAAEQIAAFCVIPASQPTVSIEVFGKTEVHKASLYARGYRWLEAAQGGVMGYFPIQKQRRVLALHFTLQSLVELHAWLTGERAFLADRGYSLDDSITPADMNYLAHKIERNRSGSGVALKLKDAREQLVEIQTDDPKPDVSNLRKRISQLETQNGRIWNGKIYGRQGSYVFYVGNQKFSATDDEVSEREFINSRLEAWDAKYKEVVQAAK